MKPKTIDTKEGSLPLAATPLFADVLALALYRHEPRGMVTMIPIENSMEPVRGCTLQGVVWIQTPTEDQRAAIVAQIPPHIASKECWPSANDIGVVVQCRCSACGGGGMLPGTKPSDDVMNTPCPQCNPWAKAKTSTHEPAIAVHNVFSAPTPGAFGVGFLHRLIASPNDRTLATQPAKTDSDSK